MLVMIDRVAGMMNAPPTPISARVAMSCSADVAIADAIEPTPKMTIPSWRAPRRPKRSPRLPAVSRRPANTSVYESIIHCSSLFDAFSPPWLSGRASVGTATFRMELSRTMMRRLKQSAPRIHHRRSWAFSFAPMRPPSDTAEFRNSLYHPTSSETQRFRIET